MPVGHDLRGEFLRGEKEKGRKAFRLAEWQLEDPRAVESAAWAQAEALDLLASRQLLPSLRRAPAIPQRREVQAGALGSRHRLSPGLSPDQV